MKNFLLRDFLVRSILAISLVFFASVAQAEGKLSIFNWFEYLPQDLIDKFAEENDVEVTMDTFDSNEAMLATLKAGKMGSYDVSVPGDYMVEIMIGEELLDTFEPSELSNFDNIDPQWLDVGFDMGRKSSIPYQIGTTGYMVNTAKYDGDIDSLSILFDPPAELSGKINVLDSQAEVLTLASLYLGIPQCTSDRDQLKQLNDTLQSAKEHWVSFGSDVAKDVLVSGDATVGMIWNGFGAKARGENEDLEFGYPKEGYVLWMDNVVLLKDAPNRANALKFMDFLLEPENAAALSNFAQYIPGVTGAIELTDDEVKEAPELNPPPGQIGEFMVACEQDVQEFYDRIWTELRK